MARLYEKKQATEIIESNVLDSYDQAVLAKVETKAGGAVKSKAISTAVTNVLNGTITEEDGSNVTVAEKMVSSVVKRIIDEGDAKGLAILAKIVGDVGPTKVEVSDSSIVNDQLRQVQLGVVLDEGDGDA